MKLRKFFLVKPIQLLNRKTYLCILWGFDADVTKQKVSSVSAVVWKVKNKYTKINVQTTQCFPHCYRSIYSQVNFIEKLSIFSYKHKKISFNSFISEEGLHGYNLVNRITLIVLFMRKGSTRIFKGVNQDFPKHFSYHPLRSKLKTVSGNFV